MTWQLRIILAKLREGCTYPQAAEAAGIHRQTLWRWLTGSKEFTAEVAKARETGADERHYRAWLASPFRGKRPPTGRGTRSVPRFRYGGGR